MRRLTQKMCNLELFQSPGEVTNLIELEIQAVVQETLKARDNDSKTGGTLKSLSDRRNRSRTLLITADKYQLIQQEMEPASP